MADQATETMEIAAPPERILDLLLDFEAYPTWAQDLKGVTVDRRDDEGRGEEVTFRAAAMGRSTSYTLRYDHRDDGLDWRLVSGDIMRQLDGSYRLEPGGGPGRTLVTYHLAVDLVIPLPGFVKRRAEQKIIHTALRELPRPRRVVTRVLLFTGKGGVGKTTTAAATALRCAEAGHRTVVLSTDPAHSLGDALDQAIGPSAEPICKGLWGQQLDAQQRMEEGWHDIQAYLRQVFQWAGVDGLEAEELSVIPGLDEIFGLSDIKAYVDADEWDVVVVDCAPTAETLRFLSLPDILARYMERLFPVGRQVTKVVGPVVSRVTSLPVADDGVFAAVSAFYERLDGVREVLTDPTRTSVRLVVNPERMVIAEARRTYTYLSLFGYPVDAVIANRILPDGISDPWFDRWKAHHLEHLRTIEDSFAPLPILTSELAPGELVGAQALRELGARLYGERDPSAVLYEGQPLRIARRGGHTTLSLDLPFAVRDDLELGRRGDELLVKVGGHRRAIALPDSLRSRRITDAALRRGRLTVTFDGSGDDG